jgi:hypothetical protein
MAIAPLAVNASNLGKEILSSLPPEITNQIGLLINIFAAVSIVFLVYIIFLIIKTFVKWKESSRIKKILINIEEINAKMDLLVRRKVPKIKK